MIAVEFPLDEERGQDLAAEWIAAWNSHDLDATMALYAPGVVFQTPAIITTLAIADGRVEGAPALRERSGRHAGSRACPTCVSISRSSSPA